VVYHPSNETSEIWVCPAAAWDETVEQNGRKIKRFRHVDEILPDSLMADMPAGINKRSDSAEKVNLFLSLFTGREDVYAKRFENAKKTKSGYTPACYSLWSPLCPKTGGGKMKCGDCPNQRFIPFNTDAVEKHLTGELTVGVYPMLPDETCRFLAFDFDGKEYNPEDLRRDVAAIRDVCMEKDINMAVERSRSGNGIHFWLFFGDYIPVGTARKFGSSLITYTMNKHHELPFKTYDRMIPNQDTMPAGGFGNLIALPLQKGSRKNENSSFIDENFNAYADQWSYLYSIKKYTQEEVEAFIRQLSPSGELGDLHKDSEDEKPWEGKKPERKLTPFDFPATVKIVRANMLFAARFGK